MKPTAKDRDATVLAQGLWIVPAFAAIGAVVGWLVKLLANWLVTLRWAPMKGPAELLNSIPEPWLTVLGVTAGVLLGVFVAFIALHEALTVRLTDTHVTLTIRDESQELGRADVGPVFLDGKFLVLLGLHAEEMAREPCDLPAAELAAAFTAHGYTWAAEDPHKSDFRLWVPDTPGLPVGANALMSARATAMRKTGTEEDVRALRGELNRLGLAVRDEKKRQYWRLPPRPSV
ncbi:hypothetical protein [Streptomyces sp. IB2014 016-6]|uniref:YqeB family protein n=1 Tax=Streptomyces sp. IB2014 016-6 TaxID=2517818 RepID=UPI0011C8E6D5|nr:hypothetical protein [Streptomyces sp. IB2014 016-6]TXL86918.1 hypothetical protein EW053_25080 [Streptomyces sp. IB2014 016-6]